MSTDLTDALNRILSWVERHEPYYVDYLYPGLSKTQIDDLIENLPIPFCPELYELYQWRNGALEADGCQDTAWIFDSWNFTPLQEIVARYQKDITNQHLGIGVPIKTPPYFRFFQGIEIFSNPIWTQSGSVFIKNTLDFCPVIFEDFEEGSLSFLKKYSSLTHMMLTIAECYETEAYFIEPYELDGYFIMRDPEKERKIWHKYNSEIIEFALQCLDPTVLCGLFFIYFSNDIIEFKDPRTVEPLIQGLQLLNHHNLAPGESFRDDPFLYFDPKEEVARILGELGDPRAVPVLIATLKDEGHNNWNYQTKVSTTKALGQIKDERAIAPLIESLNEVFSGSNFEAERMGEWGLKEVRKMAAWALGEIEDLRAAKPLIEALNDSENEVRNAAIQALTKLISKFPHLEKEIPF